MLYNRSASWCTCPASETYDGHAATHSSIYRGLQLLLPQKPAQIAVYVALPLQGSELFRSVTPYCGALHIEVSTSEKRR